MVTVTLLSMGGEGTALKPMPVADKVWDLAMRVREVRGIPISAMKLLWEGELLTDTTRTLGEVFGEEEEVDLMVVRRQISEEEQRELNQRLLRAVAGGQQAQVVELLKEGALPFAETPVATEGDEAGAGGKDQEEKEIAAVGAELDTATDAKPVVVHAEPLGCFGLSPLLLALAAGDEDLVKDLRAAGAPEPEMTPKAGSMPFAFAKQDIADVVRHLAAGADVNTKLTRGQGVNGTSWGGPLHACCSMNCFGTYELAQLLIRKKANMDMGDQEGDSPLAHARYFRNSAMQDLLQGHGAQMKGPFYSNFGT